MARLTILLVLVVCFTVSAEASTLHIIGGTITANQSAPDTNVNIQIEGGNRNLFGWNYYITLTLPIGQPTQTTFNIAFPVGPITIDGVSYITAQQTSSESTWALLMRLTLLEPLKINNPSPPPFPGGPNQFTAFAATGTLDLLRADTNEPVTFDLIGQGQVECCWEGFFRKTTWWFAPASVPEPSSLVLLTVGTLPILAYIRRRRTFPAQTPGE